MRTLENVFDIDTYEKLNKITKGQILFDNVVVTKVTNSEITIKDESFREDIFVTPENIKFLHRIFEGALNLKARSNISFERLPEITFFGNKLINDRDVIISNKGCPGGVSVIKNCTFVENSKSNILAEFCPCDGKSHKFVNCQILNQSRFYWHPGIKLINSKVECRRLQLGSQEDFVWKCVKLLEKKNYEAVKKILNIPMEDVKFDRIAFGLEYFFERDECDWLE